MAWKKLRTAALSHKLFNYSLNKAHDCLDFHNLLNRSPYSFLKKNAMPKFRLYIKPKSSKPNYDLAPVSKNQWENRPFIVVNIAVIHGKAGWSLMENGKTFCLIGCAHGQYFPIGLQVS